MVRKFACFVSAISGVLALEDEYHTTSLLQTKLERSSLKTSESKEESLLFLHGGDDEEKKSFCKMTYSEKQVEPCMVCGKDRLETPAAQAKMKKMGDMDVVMKWALNQLDECLGVKTNSMTQLCPKEKSIFGCFECSMKEWCAPGKCSKGEMAMKACLNALPAKGQGKLFSVHQQPGGNGTGALAQACAMPEILAGYKELCDDLYPNADKTCPGEACGISMPMYLPGDSPGKRAQLQECGLPPNNMACSFAYVMNGLDAKFGENAALTMCKEFTGCAVTNTECAEVGMSCEDECKGVTFDMALDDLPEDCTACAEDEVSNMTLDCGESNETALLLETPERFSRFAKLRKVLTTFHNGAGSLLSEAANIKAKMQ